MFALLLASSLSSAIPMDGSTELGGIVTTTWRPDFGAGSQLEGDQPLEMTSPGELWVDVAFQTTQADDATGGFIAPELEFVWRVRDEEGVYTPGATSDWFGFDGLEGQLTQVLSFDPDSGEGVLRIETGVGTGLASQWLPYLPDGQSTVELVFTETGFEIDEDGTLSGAQYDVLVPVWVNVPDNTLLLRPGSNPDTLAVGDDVVTTLFRTVPFEGGQDFTLRSDPIGRVTFNGEPELKVTDLAGLRGVVLEGTVQSEGLFTMTMLDSVTGDTYRSHVFETFEQSTLEIDPFFSTTDNPDGTKLEFEGGKRCRPPAPDDSFRPDRQFNCSGSYVPVIVDPPNPDCVAEKVIFYFPAKCVRGSAFCAIVPDGAKVTAQLYNVGKVETVSVGTFTVELGAKYTGGFKLISSVEIEGKVGTQAVLFKRCCKAEPVPGETGTATVDGCTQNAG